MTALPRRWATDASYASGPDVGSPPRVDPGAGVSPQGVIPHSGFAAQHFNYLLGDIIDYLHGLVGSPDTYAEIKDDFMPGWYDAADGIVHSEMTWQVSEGAASDPTSGSGEANNPGILSASVPATTSFEMHLGAELGDTPVRWGDLTHATFVFAANSSNFTGGEAFVGLSDVLSDTGPTANAVGLWLRRATSANWMVRHQVGGVDDATVSAIPIVTNEYVVFKLLRVTATQVQAYINDTLIATLTDGTTGPADSTLLAVGMMVNAGASASLNPRLDLVYVRWTTANRAT